MSSSSFTGRARKRTTSRRVRLVDRTAEWLISIAGVSTIGAVALVCLFLVWVVVPLFLPEGLRRRDHAPAPSSVAVTHVGVDEQLLQAWTLAPDGTLTVRRLSDGSTIATLGLLDGASATSHSLGLLGENGAFGLADGAVRTLALRFATEFASTSDIPELADLKPGERRVHDGGMAWITPESQVRLEKLEPHVEAAVQVAEGAAIVLVDEIVTDDGPVLASLDALGALRVSKVRQRRNLLTGLTTSTLSGGELALVPPPGKGRPSRLLIGGRGDTVLALWDDGTVQRIDTRDLTEPVLAETLDLLPEQGASITSVALLNGRSTLMVGDSQGGVRAWFATRPEGSATSDGLELTLAHELPQGASAVTSLAASPRTRMLAAGFADGSLALYHVTTNERLATASAFEGPVSAVAISPKDDAIVAVSDREISLWGIDAPHPEATVAALFRKTWYEGASAPEHVWQSSSGTDDFEPKLGLVPLVFGTIKATFYSMLFGAPLALLAAVYSSEFLGRGARSRIKPVVETMASLPSVVLGFLAALVIAPFIEGVVPEVLMTFLAVPFALLLGAHLWQLLPRERARLLEHRRFVLMFPTIGIGVALGFVAGPVAERLLFGGDLKAWLDGQHGSGVSGWILLLMPAAGLAAAWLVARVAGPVLSRAIRPSTDRGEALLALGKFLGGTVLAVALAAGAGALLVGAGWDPRGGMLGTYVQRNALVVGFMMGFAVIPIIYTIADDALASVPDHLRGASLGAGATPWQTAVRIVIPTAMSGLFSAVMVGLGRAVGETMIVLMAAGNTPVLEWNLFNGFRTLSANIAVELPEAVQGSTHFRTLFLAALVLFAMTFAVNTVAETIRLRFRKRAFEL